MSVAGSHCQHLRKHVGEAVRRCRCHWQRRAIMTEFVRQLRTDDARCDETNNVTLVTWTSTANAQQNQSTCSLSLRVSATSFGNCTKTRLILKRTTNIHLSLWSSTCRIICQAICNKMHEEINNNKQIRWKNEWVSECGGFILPPDTV